MGESITEINKLYSRVLSSVKEEINDARIYDAFLGDSYLYSIENGVATIVVNGEVAVLACNKYAEVFSRFIGDLFNQKNLKIKFVTGEKVVAPKKDEEIKPEFFATSSINPRETFDNFVVGPNNKAAQQAALLVSTGASKLYNPLFIYSNSGLGKTHLLFAIANYVREKDPTKKVLYCSADDFLTEFISYVRGESGTAKLQSFIVSHDMLLIDDIQQIANKNETELFFFQVFTKMYNAGKQIVITSDKHPEQLKGFEDRLKSRFQAGLTIAIEQPNTSTCVEILKTKINSSPINLDSFDADVLEFIAEKFSRNIRNIDEALHKIIFYTTSVNPTSHITMDVALDALQELINVKEAKTKINEQRIIAVVADYYNLTISQITGKGRPGNVTLPRHICWYLIKTMLDTSYEKIGYLFGGKDHSTVMSGVKKVENELKINSLLENAVNDIKKLLKQ